jgi:hypothetical protein
VVTLLYVSICVFLFYFLVLFFCFLRACLPACLFVLFVVLCIMSVMKFNASLGPCRKVRNFQAMCNFGCGSSFVVVIKLEY